MMDNYSGILNINKPLGWTSARIVSQIKKKIKVKKVGHCGTLDPRASGVLLICFGKATRLSSTLMNKTKIYCCTMQLGITTDTGDLDGTIISKKDPGSIDQEQIASAVTSFIGEISQIPPMYSAVKHKGEALYKIARRGKTVERSARLVSIYSLDILSYNLPEIEFRLSCSKGTYVRTLAEDIGNNLGCGAVLTSLIREAVGEYTVSNALLWEEVNSMGRDDLLSCAERQFGVQSS